MKLNLINTIEINPYDFAESAYDYPKGIDLPEEWNIFWKKCLADKKLDHLEAIRKGAYLVDVNVLDDAELIEILKNALKNLDLDDDIEHQVCEICGGIAIQLNDEFLIEPTCCGDMGNLRAWEAIFEEVNEDWKQLWIGHPWVFYRYSLAHIEFSGYYEADIDELEEVKPAFKIPIPLLRNKLETIKKEQIGFEARICNVLKEMGIEKAGQIAKLMTGNE